MPPSDREHVIQQAILDRENGLTFAKIRARWGVAPSTLRARISGADPIRVAKQTHQRLTPAQEDFIVGWVLLEESCGRAPSYAQTREFACCMLRAAGDPDPIGKHWVYRFVERNEAIRTKVGKPLSAARATYTTPGAICNFFDRLEHLIAEKSILPKNIANMDENGLQEGETAGGRVLGTALTRRCYKKASDHTNWVTIVEGITQGGKRTTPLVIFKAASLQAQWFPPNMPSWLFFYSFSGWINGEIALRWLKKIYLPETKPETPSEWRLLILDNHASHITPEFMYGAYINKVMLLYLPSHTTYVLQPLDVAVFSSLKSNYHRLTATWASYNISAPIAKQKFLISYMKASEIAFSQQNIRAGFSATGLWPVNRQKVLEKEGIFFDSAPEFRPRTPPPEPSFARRYTVATPRGSRDIRILMKKYPRSLLVSEKMKNSALYKSGKKIDMQQARILQLEERIHQFEEEVREKKARKRVAVKFDANREFGSIVEINESQKELYSEDEEDGDSITVAR